MKRMTTKQKIAGCAAAALILLIVALFAVNIGYDEVGDSIRKAEKGFGIEGIDYEECCTSGLSKAGLWVKETACWCCSCPMSLQRKSHRSCRESSLLSLWIKK
ncbi:MAG: hypothetical protein MR884_04040 [Clostridiales bacterium]|nr:hypothetical protein [Clostridiales bacterium]